MCPPCPPPFLLTHLSTEDPGSGVGARQASWGFVANLGRVPSLLSTFSRSPDPRGACKHRECVARQLLAKAAPQNPRFPLATAGRFRSLAFAWPRGRAGPSRVCPFLPPRSVCGQPFWNCLRCKTNSSHLEKPTFSEVNSCRFPPGSTERTYSPGRYQYINVHSQKRGEGRVDSCW